MKLFILVGAFLAAFLAFAAVSWNMISQVKINGPIYNQIVDGKDVISDILPPPEYIIESYLKVLQMTDEADPVRLSRLIEDSHRLRNEYDKRHEFWSKQLPPGRM